MNRTESNYQAYLLRLWRDSPNNRWRASLQSTKASDAQLFADVKDLIAFLQAQTAESEADCDAEPQREPESVTAEDLNTPPTEQPSTENATQPQHIFLPLVSK